MEIVPTQFDMMQKLMETGLQRHKVISHNLANVNTPGYKRLDVSFEDQLGALLAKSGSTEPDGLDQLTARVFEEKGLAQRADGNNVDVDKEVGQLEKNSLLYQTYSQLLSSKLAMMRSAIRGQ